MYQQKPMDVPIVQPAQESRQYLHTRTAGVEVPLLQSAALGGMTFVFVTVIGLVFYWIDPWKPASVIGMAVAFAWMFFSLTRWTSLTKPEQPQVLVRSVDHDENPSTPEVIRIQFDRVDNGRYKQTSLFDLPAGISRSQMRELAVGLLEAKRPWSIREWAGAGKTFSDPKWRELQSVMLRHQLLEPKSERGSQRGFQLTEEGVRTMESFLAVPSPTNEEV